MNLGIVFLGVVLLSSVGYSPPIGVYVNSSKDVYGFGEVVFLNASASSQQEIVNISIYVDDALVNTSRGNYVNYSGVFYPGIHSYFANASDIAGRKDRDPDSGYKYFAVLPEGTATPLPADKTPPQISMSSDKYSYSNNETVYLRVVANDSISLDVTQVLLYNAVKCVNSTPAQSHEFVCAVGPFADVKNGTYATYYATAKTNDTSNNVNQTSVTFMVFGNSSCNDLGYPVNENQCASNGTQSFICNCYSTGCVLSKKCTDVCYCPSGFSCNSTNQVCSLPPGALTCSDGTLYGQCSVTIPAYCSNGNLVNSCTQCGCPTGQACNSTSQGCYVLTTPSCSDGTPYGRCSVIKPKYCNNGVLIDYCSLCGCLSGTQCSPLNGSCFVPSNPERYIRLELISPNAPSMVLSRGQTVLFNVKIKDERGRLVSNATMMLNPKTMNYTSTNLGDGLYGVSYKVSLSATGSFLISIMATRGENETDTLTLQVNISRMLDIEFLNPAQNANVMDDRQVEVKINYPNGDPVMLGNFEMGLGNRTFALEKVGDKYRGFLNLSAESYGTKNISVYGQDVYGNSLDGLLVINYIERKDYTIFFIALLLVVGGSIMAYFVYTWASSLSKDYKTLKKEKVYLETMDKRTHLEFFKRHIDENTFKKLALEYQQKTTDVDRIITEMEKRHRWLRWL